VILFLYTNLLDDPDLQYYLGGYAFIGVFCLNVSVNLLSIFISGILTAFRSIRYRYLWLRYRLRRVVMSERKKQGASYIARHASRGGAGEETEDWTIR
jgi:hypothetical protein